MAKLSKARQEAIITNYNNSNNYSLADVYTTWSASKSMAERFIHYDMTKIGGYGYKILGHNSNTFSCAYKYDDINGDTHLVYHTYCNKYDIIL